MTKGAAIAFLGVLSLVARARAENRCASDELKNKSDLRHAVLIDAELKGGAVPERLKLFVGRLQLAIEADQNLQELEKESGVTRVILSQCLTLPGEGYFDSTWVDWLHEQKLVLLEVIPSPEVRYHAIVPYLYKNPKGGLVEVQRKGDAETSETDDATAYLLFAEGLRSLRDAKAKKELRPGASQAPADSSCSAARRTICQAISRLDLDNNPSDRRLVNGFNGLAGALSCGAGSELPLPSLIETCRRKSHKDNDNRPAPRTSAPAPPRS